MIYEVLISTTRFIDHFIIDRIHYALLFILLFAKIRKSIDKTGAFQVVRFIMLSYSTLTIIQLLLPLISGLDLKNETWDFLERAYHSEYDIFTHFIIFLVLNCVLPLILFSNKLANNTWLVILLAVLMNGGKIFENFVMTVISFHRDYPDLSEGFERILSTSLISVAYGICGSVIAISLSLLLKKIKKPKML